MTAPTVREYAPPAGAQEALVGGIMRQALRFGLKPFLGSPWPFAVQRMALALGSALMPQDLRATVSHEQIGAIGAERIRPKIAGRATPFAILYLHGGAFVAGSPRTHRSITRRLCAITGAQVLVPDYRLAPEAKFPAQINDCLLAYQQLLNEGVPAHRIAIAGDSAGGNLAYMTALAAIQQGLPAPAVLCLIACAAHRSGTGPRWRQPCRPRFA
jgi:epsilon-lactone hydrolase